MITNGGGPCNVFWQVGSSATLGTGNTFVGNILALTSISLATNTNVSGRALARNGSVTMDSNNISIESCGVVVPTATATLTAPTATSTSDGPTATVTTGPAPTATNTQVPPGPTATNLPAVTALPGTGGAPIRNDVSPWGLVIAGGLITMALVLGIQAYRKTSRPRQ